MIRALMVIVCMGAQMTRAEPALDRALMAFAADLSGNDPAMATRVAAILANPPRKVKELGFYGLENAPEAERAFRATIFALSEAGLILDFEDKYIHELPELLVEAGWIASTDDYIAGIRTAYEREASGDEINHLAQTGFAAHVAGIEAAAGPTLLYIDLPLGDTFHLARLGPESARRWRDTLFVQTPEAHFAVTDPQWDIYWRFLTYAMRLEGAPPVAPYDLDRLQSLAEAGFP